MKVLLKDLKGLEGLTEMTDTDVCGTKNKWSYMFALERLLEKLERFPSDSITIATSNAGYLTDVEFSKSKVYRYCKVHFLTVHENIQDLINYLEAETTKD